MSGTLERPRLLSEDQIKNYKRDGWTKVENLLSSEDLRIVSACNDKADTIQAPVSRGLDDDEKFAYRADDKFKRMGRQIRDLRLYFEELRPIVAKVGDVARDLLRTSDIRILWDKTFDKAPARTGARLTSWHQDAPILPIDRRGLLTIWMPLQKVTAESGALRFVPGSHRLGALGPIAFRPGSYDRPEPTIEDLLTEDDLEFVRPPVTVPLSAGDATVHDGMMLHGAGPNLTNETRKVWVCVFIPGDICWNGSPLTHTNFDSYDLKPFRPFNHPDLMVG